MESLWVLRKPLFPLVGARGPIPGGYLIAERAMQAAGPRRSTAAWGSRAGLDAGMGRWIGIAG